MARQWSCVLRMLLVVATLLEAAQAATTAVFILGDSLVDPGNNNYIPTLARANNFPNGIDFPAGTTGRFCNGRTVADVLSQLLNLPFVPAYLDPNTKGNAILGGVNYASAAGGILESTGLNFLGRISLNQQLQNFQQTTQQLASLLGPAGASQLLSSSVFSIVIGNNDYINNYLLPGALTARQFSPKQYEGVLVSELSKQLTTLYRLGARKIAVFSGGPLGCIPAQLAFQLSRDGSCIKFINDYVVGFNTALEAELVNLRASLPGSTFLYGNSYDLVFDRVQNPQRYGITVANRGCCGVGIYNGVIPCIVGVRSCNQRDSYLFWDEAHPTDFVNVQLGNEFFSGGLSSIRPMNIQQLAALP